MLEYVACNLCGQDDNDVLFTKQGTLEPLDFNIIRCKPCGLVYVNPRLAATPDLYDESYYRGEGFDRHMDDVSEYERNDPRKHRLSVIHLKSIGNARQPSEGDKLLDIGCGLGEFVKTAVEFGYDAMGVEWSEYAYRMARTSGINVRHGEVADLIGTHQFDVITAIEVIEHHYDPMTLFEQVSILLREGGLFFYTTANFDVLYRSIRRGKKNTKAWNYIKPEGHIYYFTPDTIRTYFLKAGLIPVEPYDFYDYRRGAIRLMMRFRLLSDTHSRPVHLRERVCFAGLQLVDRARGKVKDLMPLARKLSGNATK